MYPLGTAVTLRWKCVGSTIGGNSEERRRLGSWYTPPALIEQMLDLLTAMAGP